MPSPSSDRSNAENASMGARLDGWKEIATFLGRGDRTVKRWEVGRGLPIHRVPGGGRASVYAFSVELDQWLKSSEILEVSTGGESAAEPDLASPPLVEERTPRFIPRNTSWFSRRRIWLLAAVSGLLMVILARAALQVVALPSAVKRFNAALPSLFSSGHAKPNPTQAPRVSDSEKSLARDLYLKGRYEWNERTPDSLNHALESFTQAIVHDPGSAQAYAGLADTYDLLPEYSTMPESYAFPRAIAAARKAVELDDTLAEAHRALAFAERYGSWDFADSEKEYLRAIELNPRDPVARLWYANSFAVPGRFRESLEQIDKAQELDPTSHATLADKGMLLFMSEKREEGIELLKEVERTDPAFRSPNFYRMLISLIVRDYPTYLAEGEKTAEVENDPVLKDIVAAARTGYERDGEHGLLISLYARQKEYYLEGKVSGTMLAKTCVMLGRKQEALDLLETAYARHEEFVLSCLQHPDLLTLKDEPRYKALVKKINFPSNPPTASPSRVTAAESSPLQASFEPR